MSLSEEIINEQPEKEVDGFSESDPNDDDIYLELRKAPFEILAPEVVRVRMAEALQQTAAVTMLPEDEAGRLLRHYKWDQAAVSQAYFGDKHGVREQLGLSRDPDAAPPPAQNAPSPISSPLITQSAGPATTDVTAPAKQTCDACFEDCNPGDMLALACGHPFCKDCWCGHITKALADGLRVLDLRCLQAGCSAAVLRPTLGEILTAEMIQKVDQFALRSFVEGNKSYVWCPSPDCPYVAQSRNDAAGEAQDITCKCGATFCFNCKEEAHCPVDCDTVKRWLTKSTADQTWILINTKPCPQCRQPIEKNQGGMQMTCAECGHDFCWLCRTGWKDHDEGTGGFYVCNRIDHIQMDGAFSEEEARWRHAKHSLERYMHYWERYAQNDLSQQTARFQAAYFLKEDLEALTLRILDSGSLLISNALAQVADCRRILKWTYAYGYYAFMPPGLREDDPAEPVGCALAVEASSEVAPADLAWKQRFFEFSQGQAEKYLEVLHKMVEKEVQPFLPRVAPISPPQAQWEAYRSRLVSMMALTLDHYTKLVTELDGGMGATLHKYGPAAPVDEGNRQVQMTECSADGSQPTRGRCTTADATMQAAEVASLAYQADVDEGWSCGACTMFHGPQAASYVYRMHCSVCETIRDSMPPSTWSPQRHN